MNALVSSFVKKVQANHCESLKRRTRKLDRADRENLLEFLEDHLPSSNATVSDVSIRKVIERSRDGQLQESETKTGGDIESNLMRTTASVNVDVDIDDLIDTDDDDSIEDYEFLQRDLDRANIKLEELQTKRDFLRTRLQAYRSKINSAEESMYQNAEIHAKESNGDPESKEKYLVAMKEKIEGYKTSLEPIQNIYEHIESELTSNRLMIESLQDRQFELKLKTEECRVVLHELVARAETNVRADERNDETNDYQGSIGTATNADDCSSYNDASKIESDMENVKRNREEATEEEKNEIARKTTSEESGSLLVVPTGGHLEIEPNQEEN